MLCSYRQMRRDYKIKFTDKSKANLWIHLDLAKVHHLKGLTSPYINPYLHFLNLNNILTLPQTSVITEDGFGLTRTDYVRLVFCLTDLRACVLVYEIKTCKPSINLCQEVKCSHMHQSLLPLSKSKIHVRLARTIQGGRS